MDAGNMTVKKFAQKTVKIGSKLKIFAVFHILFVLLVLAFLLWWWSVFLFLFLFLYIVSCVLNNFFALSLSGELHRTLSLGSFSALATAKANGKSCGTEKR